MSKPITVSDTDFDQTLADNSLVLVDFWAEWCGPCRMVAPVMEELAADYDGKITVAKLDIDANPNTAMKFRVMSIPTVILFKDGQPVDVMVGFRPKPAYSGNIDKHLSEAVA